MIKKIKVEITFYCYYRIIHDWVIILLSDEQLAVQLQQGDETALDAIVHRYHGPIHAYIVRMGCEYHSADDIVQEVFIKVCGQIGLFLKKPSFSTVDIHYCCEYL